MSACYMNASEHVQAIVTIAFERVPADLRTPFEQLHAGVTVTRVVKQTSTLGRVTYDVHFVDGAGHPGEETLIGPQRRDWGNAATRSLPALKRKPRRAR